MRALALAQDRNCTLQHLCLVGVAVGSEIRARPSSRQGGVTQVLSSTEVRTLFCLMARGSKHHPVLSLNKKARSVLSSWLAILNKEELELDGLAAWQPGTGGGRLARHSTGPGAMSCRVLFKEMDPDVEGRCSARFAS